MLDGAENETTAEALPAVAETPVGEPGGEGQMPYPSACSCCRPVQIPEKLGMVYLNQ